MKDFSQLEAELQQSIKITLYNACVQYIRGCSVHRGVFSTLGDTISTLGDIISTSGVFNTSGGYYDACGDIMSTSGDVQ